MFISILVMVLLYISISIYTYLWDYPVILHRINQVLSFLISLGLAIWLSMIKTEDEYVIYAIALFSACWFIQSIIEYSRYMEVIAEYDDKSEEEDDESKDD